VKLGGVVVAVLVVLVAVAAAAAMFVRWPGGLESYGNAVAAQMSVGGVSSFGMGTVTAGDWSVRVEEVRLHGAPRGVALVGAILYYGNGCVGFGVIRGFPPCKSKSRLPARNAVVPAHHRFLLWVGVRVPQAGRFRVFGVDVLYRMRWHGIELRRRAHIGSELDLCAPRPGCKSPVFQGGS
jgi:hypothetical protein